MTAQGSGTQESRGYPVDLLSPAQFARRVSLDLDAIEFVPMTRETYAASAFLDDRIMAAGNAHWVPLDALPGELFASSLAPGPRRYIFHSAFCCSTLLCRLLEQLPGTMTLKEPYLPVQIANELIRGPKDESDRPSPWSADELQRIRSLSDRLLERTWPGTPHAVVKFSDRLNILIESYIARPQSKVLFVHGSLASFLRSVLSRGELRTWVRKERLELLAPAGYLHPLLDDIAPGDLTDAQATACLWLDRALTCADLAAKYPPGRFLPIDGMRLKTDPVAILLEAAAFFGLSQLFDRAIEAAVRSSLQFDSKRVGRRFEPTAGGAGRPGCGSLELEIGNGLEWAARRLEGRSTPMQLQGTGIPA